MKDMMCTYNQPKSTFLKRITTRSIFCALLCSTSLVCSGELALSTANKTEETGKQFEYIIEDRADPFVPFITAKSATSTVDMNEIIDKKIPLTGMQLFEPGQLNLVALLRNDSRDMAMVEDFTGKGYVLFEGTKIGRRGVVKDIATNSVLIEETAVTRAGKEIITKIVMTLKKEGEE